ncbi:MAG: hypothetical protein SGI77_06500 [Pirellulaceae bacterium]|nr:hypothetical protein [Pirellulaceae bacterium]
MSLFSLSRRTVLRWSLIVGLLGTQSQTAVAQQGLEGFDANIAEQMLDLNSVELRIQLQSGLRIFLPEQQEFLDKLLASVDRGELPRAMVNLVYVWALRRNKKIPFPYFEIAMRTLAERRGVDL